MRTMVLSLLILVTASACSMPSGRDPCLQGDWVMSNEDLNIMLLTLVPIPGLSIPAGTFLLRFEGDEFVYGSDAFTLQIDFPDGYMSAEAGFATDGKFTAEDGILAFTDMVSSKNISHWVAMKDGRVVDAPGSYEVAIPPPGGGPYSCSDHLLSITSMTPMGEPFTLIFTR
jgi:hypothetical protein